MLANIGMSCLARYSRHTCIDCSTSVRPTTTFAAARYRSPSRPYSSGCSSWWTPIIWNSSTSRTVPPSVAFSTGFSAAPPSAFSVDFPVAPLSSLSSSALSGFPITAPAPLGSLSLDAEAFRLRVFLSLNRIYEWFIKKTALPFVLQPFCKRLRLKCLTYQN